MAPPLTAQIVSAVKKLGGSQGPILSANGTRQYEEAWVVRTKTRADGKMLVDLLQDKGTIPRIGGAFESDPAATCVNVEVDRDEDTELVFVITAEFSTSPPENPDQDTSPVKRPSKLSWGFREVEVAPLEDASGSPEAPGIPAVSGKLYLNSIGDPLETPLIIPEVHSVLSIVRNELSFNSSLALSLANKVNDAAWLGAATGTVKADPPSAGEQFTDGFSYWAVTYRFEYDPKGWNPTRVLNAGRKYRKNGQGPKILIPDEQGVLSGDVQLLKANGDLLTDFTQPHWLEFTQFKTTNFNVFNLP